LGLFDVWDDDRFCFGLLPQEIRTVTDPTDAELLEWIARFAGWRNFKQRTIAGSRPIGVFGNEEEHRGVPDYLNSVDVFLADVWPKIKGGIVEWDWCDELELLHEGTIDLINASARSRCFALYRALDGKLP
jgi:hypothetical protein